MHPPSSRRTVGWNVAAASRPRPTRNTASISEKDRASVRCFQKIDDGTHASPTRSRSSKARKPYFEEYCTRFATTAVAVKASVELAAKYINDRKLLDKAIDVIDEVGASQMLLPGSCAARKVIGVEGSRGSCSERWRAFLPNPCTKTDTEALAQRLETELRRVVYGRDLGDPRAVLCDQSLARAGLRHPEKPLPLAAIRFPARPAWERRRSRKPARQRIMGVELLRFDMLQIHGAPYRFPRLNRRTTGLCRLRPGWTADRRESTSILTAYCCWTKSKRRIPDHGSTFFCRSWITAS